MERRFAGTMFTVGLLTVTLMKISVLWTFLVATALGATAALGVLLSFAISCIHQHKRHDIQSVGTELR